MGVRIRDGKEGRKMDESGRCLASTPYIVPMYESTYLRIVTGLRVSSRSVVY